MEGRWREGERGTHNQNILCDRTKTVFNKGNKSKKQKAKGHLLYKLTH